MRKLDKKTYPLRDFDADDQYDSKLKEALQGV
jgi:hypothetical protein